MPNLWQSKQAHVMQVKNMTKKDQEQRKHKQKNIGAVAVKA